MMNINFSDSQTILEITKAFQSYLSAGKGILRLDNLNSSVHCLDARFKGSQSNLKTINQLMKSIILNSKSFDNVQLDTITRSFKLLTDHIANEKNKSLIKWLTYLMKGGRSIVRESNDLIMILNECQKKRIEEFYVTDSEAAINSLVDAPLNAYKIWKMGDQYSVMQVLPGVKQLRTYVLSSLDEVLKKVQSFKTRAVQYESLSDKWANDPEDFKNRWEKDVVGNYVILANPTSSDIYFKIKLPGDLNFETTISEKEDLFTEIHDYINAEAQFNYLCSFHAADENDAKLKLKDADIGSCCIYKSNSGDSITMLRKVPEEAIEIHYLDPDDLFIQMDELLKFKGQYAALRKYHVKDSAEASSRLLSNSLPFAIYRTTLPDTLLPVTCLVRKFIGPKDLVKYFSEDNCLLMNIGEYLSFKGQVQVLEGYVVHSFNEAVERLSQLPVSHFCLVKEQDSIKMITSYWNYSVTNEGEYEFFELVCSPNEDLFKKINYWTSVQGQLEILKKYSPSVYVLDEEEAYCQLGHLKINQFVILYTGQGELQFWQNRNGNGILMQRVGLESGLFQGIQTLIYANR